MGEMMTVTLSAFCTEELKLFGMSQGRHGRGGWEWVGGMCGRETWEDLLQPEPGCKIEDIDVFASHLAVYERTSHGQRLRYSSNL